MVWNKNKNIRDAAEWFPEKIHLLDDKEKMLIDQRRRQRISGQKEPLRLLYRGGVYWVDFGKGNVGAEKEKLRPAVIISPNHLNKAETVIVIPISSKFKSKIERGKVLPFYRNHLLLYKDKYSELDETSAIKCEDMRSIDVVRVKDIIFNIDKTDLDLLKLRLFYMLGY